jgi:membrane-bound serine protease (ClpP class)
LRSKESKTEKERYSEMALKILLIIIACYVAFELIEHLVLPLIWLVMGKKKKAVTGPSGLIGETAEVKDWHQFQGKVFVHGELWWAECDVPLKPGDRVVVEGVERLTLKVAPRS